MEYEAFCFADPLFFDEQREDDRSADGFTARLASPDGWNTGMRGVWRELRPIAHELPDQGWKIHVSAGLDNAQRVLATVHAYCVGHRIAYKHLRSPSIMLMRNSKYAPRASSGKLITIYPADERILERTLADLSTDLRGEHGAYILSDLRYGDGPLYVRYGGFVERWVEADSARVLAVRKPDGTLVADKREPAFSVPDWVAIPACLRPHIAARKAGDPGQFPYRIVRSLHFSNGGGVYLADRESDGRRVVLKEARPHAGLDIDQVDAVERLRHEQRILQRLAGIRGIPEVHGRRTVWEHDFLEMQYMPGIPLGSWLARNYPLTRRGRTEADIRSYTERALNLLARIENMIKAIHARGIVFGDLHAHNLLVDEHDELALIDFELAADADSGTRPALGAPGFRARDGRSGFAIDEYALAAFRLWFFLPLNTMLGLAPGKLAGLVSFVERRFDLPDGFAESIVAELSPRTGPVYSGVSTELDQAEPDWTKVGKQIAEGILASASPERTDRLFPGDINQFALGGACFANGAAGVLHALDVAGAGRYPEHEAWLLESVRRQQPRRPGFFDGDYGIAYVLENLGYHCAAEELLSASGNLVSQTTGHSLESGLAGIGLTQLHFALTRQDEAFERRASVTARQLVSALDTAAAPGKLARAGLLHGWSGPALLFIRLFERTGEPEWLAAADRALRRDIEECVSTDDNALQVRDGTRRTLPYAGVGSAGILMVARQLAEHAPESSSLTSLAGLRDACLGEFVAFPGLLFGRAGLLAALAMDPAPDQLVTEAIGRHLSRLAWHAVPYQGGLAFPGNLMLRLSVDLATGSAGVLLALAAVLDGRPVLPFFTGTASPTSHRSLTAGGSNEEGKNSRGTYPGIAVTGHAGEPRARL